METNDLPEPAEVRRLIEEHVRRANTLRQIQSNKASSARVGNTIYVIATIVIATFVSVAGFGGLQKLKAVLDLQFDAEWIDLIYSLLVVLILIITLVGIVLRFDERANRHNRSIEILTEFIRDWEDALALSHIPGRELAQPHLLQARTRYKGIILSLPPNSDKEYERAKKAAKSKKTPAAVAAENAAIERRMPLQATTNFSTSLETADRENSLRLLIADSPSKRAILALVETELGSRAWITGGFVRDAVWDRLHAHRLPSPLEDIDIVYFDKVDTTEASELVLMERLLSRAPNVKWSVKNEARMHTVAGDQPYKSLEDAISRFPETATAVAVQLDKGKFRVIAPLGLEDLFTLKLKENPRANSGAFARRMLEKKWLDKWPRLSIERNSPPER